MTPTPGTDKRAERTTRREADVLRRAEWISRVFDQRFRVPGTSFRFGYDAILGLLPVAGDTLSAVVSLYLILEALRLRLGVRPAARMLMNVLIDWLVGLIPIADVFLDAAYKANTRNARIIAEEIDRKRAQRDNP